MDNNKDRLIKVFGQWLKYKAPIVSSFFVLFEALYGPRYARLDHKRNCNDSITSSIDTISRRWPDIKKDCTDQPIFIFSAGWRSGSTLVQRLVMSEEPIIMWGEPYSHSGIFDGLMKPFTSITDRWPNEEWFITNFNTDELNQNWVANLYPTIQSLYDANLSYFNNLFVKPAQEAGSSRWGIKDVRLSIDHAYFFRWLFPNCKIIFLYRNPYDAYASYRPARNWYKEWPNQPVFTPRKFAQHWNELATGFHENYKDVDGYLLKYEDIISGEANFDELSEYLNVKINKNLLKKNVGSSNVKLADIPRYELKMIQKEVNLLAAQLGYKLT